MTELWACPPACRGSRSSNSEPGPCFPTLPLPSLVTVAEFLPQHAHAAWSESAVGWEFRRLAVGVESTVFHGTDCLRGEGAGRGEMAMLRSLHGWGAPCG